MPDKAEYMRQLTDKLIAEQYEDDQFSISSMVSQVEPQNDAKENHPLRCKFVNCSWNNIPLPVKELFNDLISVVTANENTFNERKAI